MTRSEKNENSETEKERLTAILRGKRAQGKDIGVSWIGLLGNNSEIPSMPSFSDKAGDKAFRVSLDFFPFPRRAHGKVQFVKRIWREKAVQRKNHIIEGSKIRKETAQKEEEWVFSPI